MKPIEDLKSEHEAVKITLKVLDSIVNDAEKTGHITNPAHLGQLIEFFRTFVDRCHHSKEEDLLFPALEEVGVSKKEGPIGVMLKEHQQGRDRHDHREGHTAGQPAPAPDHRPQCSNQRPQ